MPLEERIDSRGQFSNRPEMHRVILQIPGLIGIFGHIEQGIRKFRRSIPPETLKERPSWRADNAGLFLFREYLVIAPAANILATEQRRERPARPAPVKIRANIVKDYRMEIHVRNMKAGLAGRQCASAMSDQGNRVRRKVKV